VRRIAPPYVIDRQDCTHMMQSTLDLWAAVVLTVSWHTGVGSALLVERPKAEKHPLKRVHEARTMTVHVLFTLIDVGTAQTWLRLCCNYSHGQQRDFLKKKPDRALVYALSAMARNRWNSHHGATPLSAQLQLGDYPR